MFGNGRHFHPNVMVASKAKSLSGASLSGRLPVILVRIKLDWRGQSETNTLAYYEHFSSYVPKKFYNIRSRVNMLKIFM